MSLGIHLIDTSILINICRYRSDIYRTDEQVFYRHDMLVRSFICFLQLGEILQSKLTFFSRSHDKAMLYIRD
jgi:hypothetical protein